MESNVPHAPRYLSRQEIKAQKALKKSANISKWDYGEELRRRAVKKTAGQALKKQRTVGVAEKFCHVVLAPLNRFATTEQRTELRQWFFTQNITAYHVHSTGVDVDVIWNRDWSKFFFANNHHAMMFNMVWC